MYAHFSHFVYLYLLMKQLDVDMGTSPNGCAHLALLQPLKLLQPEGEQVPLLLHGLQVEECLSLQLTR